MIHRRTLIALAAFGLASLPFTALAAENVPYTDAAFAAAKAEGRPILIEIFAEWCSTCRAQRPVISALQQKSDFKDLVVLKVDFDSQKDVVRAFDARMQSTLIAFKGETEVGRSVGVSDPAGIEALVLSAVRG